MITTERAYKITRAAAAKFRTAIAAAESGARAPASTPAAVVKMTTAAMRAQLAALERELEVYDRMKRGDAEFRPAPLEDLGALLVQARIARGWTQKELGDQVGVLMQQIQNYEQTGYARASLTRLREVALALGSTITTTLELTSIVKELTRDRAKRRRISPR